MPWELLLYLYFLIGCLTWFVEFTSGDGNARDDWQAFVSGVTWPVTFAVILGLSVIDWFDRRYGKRRDGK